MIEAAAINTVAGAFAAGLATSVHCVGMCGPLACLAGAGGKVSTKWSRALGAGGYHIGRTASYAGVGALAGWLGRGPLETFSSTPARLLPWALAIALVAFALGLEKKIPRPKAVSRWLFKARLAFGKRSPAVGGTMLGLATPLLPCAPLYVVFGLALLSGSAAAGAEFTAAFALGTVPLLLLAGGAFRWISAHFGPGSITGIRRAVALLAAAAIILRMTTGTPMAAPDPHCPFCP
jgi:sulfite exporter TauE/SafE